MRSRVNTKYSFQSVVMGLIVAAGAHVSAQTQGFRVYNPFRVGFSQVALNVKAPDRAKLIEVGPLLDDNRSSLIFLIGGQEKNDYRRSLRVTHWDGFAFSTDATLDFTGWSVDPLLLGRFRTQHVAPPPIDSANDSAALPTEPSAPKGRKVKKPKEPHSRQVVTSGGIFAWSGGGFTRIADPPPSVKLSLVLEGSPDQLIINYGDAATLYEVGDNEIHASAYTLNPRDLGYPHWGLGTQFFDGAKEFAPGERFAQAYWKDRDRWVICLQKGNSANVPNDPDATTGDRVRVYIPKASNRDKTFWQLTRPEDYEETWTSGPLAGRVLDVRVGDLRNEGKLGILVLTAENNDRDRVLSYFVVVRGQ